MFVFPSADEHYYRLDFFIPPEVSIGLEDHDERAWRAIIGYAQERVAFARKHRAEYP